MLEVTGMLEMMEVMEMLEMLRRDSNAEKRRRCREETVMLRREAMAILSGERATVALTESALP